MDISTILSGFVAFYGEINNSFKLQRENSVIQQDLTSVIIPHASQAIKEKSSNIVILANDADVVVLVLYYMETFVREVSQKLWIRYGTGDHTRYLPIHIMYGKLGASFCSVLLNAHILTGCDMTSKVGTKESTIKVKPDKFLHAFGSTDEINFLRQSEEYILQVVPPTARCTTFDELRFENYTGKKASLINLPPTSNSIKGHLCLCFFIIQQKTSVFNKTENHADPCEFGWVVDSDAMFRSDKMLLSMPEHYTVRCGCKSKCTKRCKCKNIEIDCTEFCKCKGLCET